jgi:hypothetical protein
MTTSVIDNQTTNGQATETERPVFDVVVDCGNSNVKASLVRGARILDTIHFSSKLKFVTPGEVYLAWAGFTLAGESVNVAENCGDFGSIIHLGQVSDGKLRYLKYMLAGVCSAFHRKVGVGSHIRFHILTLGSDSRTLVQESIEALAGNNLQVDGNPQLLTVELAQLLPEGAGCSYFVANAFKKAKAISVLDIGGGTMNFSAYTLKEQHLPQRTSFEFEAVGMQLFKSGLHSQIKQTTTNGQVNKTLVEYALVQNSSTLMDGTDISKPLKQAVETWLNSTEVKSMLTKARNELAIGGYVGCCGGGWKITAVSEAIVNYLIGDSPTEELAIRLLVPDEADVLSVIGVAKSIAATARRLQKQASENKRKQEDLTSGEPKPKRSRKPKQADEQQPESASESLAGVSEVGASEPSTSSRASEPSALGVATSDEHTTNVETTTAQG